MLKLRRLASALCISSLVAICLACSNVERRNDLLVDIAVSQGVARFVEAGSSAADQAERKERLITALGIARQFVSSDVVISSVDWSNDFLRLIDVDTMPVSDQLLLRQVLMLIRDEIDARADEAGVKVYLGRVIDVAINTAGGL